MSAASSILVIGHRGMLGRELMERLGGRAAGVDVGECDITDPAQVEAALDELRPRCVINCAAYTAVDQAESEPEAARRINADAVETLARAAARRDLHLITISTDYVFTGEGDAPWPEDAPEEAFGPRSVYGRTKLEGERRARAAGGRLAIVRTQWLYGAGGGNFVDSIAALARERDSLRVVDDQVGAPTWARDLAAGLELLAERGATGNFHVVNSGFDSWFEVARHVAARLGLAARIEPCASEEFPRPAPRPKNSRLSQDKYAALASAPMRPWRDALDQYLAGRPR